MVIIARSIFNRMKIAEDKAVLKSLIFMCVIQILGIKQQIIFILAFLYGENKYIPVCMLQICRLLVTL